MPDLRCHFNSFPISFNNRHWSIKIAPLGEEDARCHMVNSINNFIACLISTDFRKEFVGVYFIVIISRLGCRLDLLFYPPNDKRKISIIDSDYWNRIIRSLLSSAFIGIRNRGDGILDFPRR